MADKSVFYYFTLQSEIEMQNNFFPILMPFLVNQDGFIEMYTSFYVTWKIDAFAA